ncbi:MAG: hypothetical protein Q4F95_04850 [Oscillospiraceae bacterium]|nr:hypothetical protein [Oscillospiraceae bacterium]
MYKQLKALILCILCMCFISGCGKTVYKKIHIDKARETAQKYLDDKYDEEYEVVKWGKRKNGAVPFSDAGDEWAELVFRIKGDDSQTQYTILMKPSDETTDKEYQYEIVSDNFMTSKVKPVLEKELELQLSNAGVGKYNGSISVIWQTNSKTNDGFLPDFPVDVNEDNISELLNTYKVCFRYIYRIPESKYSKGLELQIKEVYENLFKDNYVDLEILIFKDDEIENQNAVEINSFNYKINE